MPAPPTSRAAFLARLRAVVPPAKPLPPPYPGPEAFPADLLERFIETTRAVGGTVHVLATDETLADVLDTLAPATDRLVGPGLDATGRPLPAQPHDLADVSVVAARAVVGVAEDAAVLVADLDHIGPPVARLRSAPFLALHLVLVLGPGAIVPDLHAAHARPDVQAALDRADFAVWISGPSKTADIAQTLVHGAHGPEQLTVVVGAST